MVAGYVYFVNNGSLVFCWFLNKIFLIKNVVKNKISKVVGILYRLNNIFPKNILQTLYNSLIASYINYELLLWGVESNRIELLQKKAIGLITNSNYTTHHSTIYRTRLTKDTRYV